MDRQRPAAVLGALLVSASLGVAPVASAQQGIPGVGIVVDDLPVLSELPPLPVNGHDATVTEEPEPSDFGTSGVQAVALVLAGTVLVAGVVGLSVVTRRGRSEEAPEGDDEAGTPVP